MNLLKIPPVAAAVMALSIAVPVMAAGHAPGAIPSQAVTHGSPPSHSVVLPSSAASHADAVAGSSVANHATTNPGATHNHGSNHTHGASSQILQDVQQLRTIQGQVHAARQQYVAAVKTYLHTLSQSLSTGSTSSMQQALSQLQTINTTLGHAVQTEMTAEKAHASTNSHSGPAALSNVVAKFHAELTALQQATTQVQSLTAQISSNTNP